MSLNINEGIAFIDTVGDLSAMPSLALDVMGMLNDPSSTVKDIVAKIRLDPAMVSYILKNCNSPLYGIRSEVTSVVRAVNLLGFSTLKSILMSYFMRNLYQLSGKSEIKEKLWKHSVAVAVFSKNLAVQTNIKRDAEDIYVAGLLHDIGKIVLYLENPEQYEEIIQSVGEGEYDFITEEKRVLKFNHADVGYFLLTKWKFSRLLIDVVHHHHDPEFVGDEKEPAIGLVAFADLMAHEFIENRPEDLEPSLKRFNLTHEQAEDIAHVSMDTIDEFYGLI